MKFQDKHGGKHTYAYDRAYFRTQRNSVQLRKHTRAWKHGQKAQASLHLCTSLELKQTEEHGFTAPSTIMLLKHEKETWACLCLCTLLGFSQKKQHCSRAPSISVLFKHVHAYAHALFRMGYSQTKNKFQDKTRKARSRTRSCLHQECVFKP